MEKTSAKCPKSVPKSGFLVGFGEKIFILFIAIANEILSLYLAFLFLLNLTFCKKAFSVVFEGLNL